jgi:hypothetical protein
MILGPGRVRGRYAIGQTILRYNRVVGIRIFKY